MEDVLDLYAEPYNPSFPVVCFDERPYQLISETRLPVPATVGQLARYDFEYRRTGMCNLFAYLQPLAAWRHVVVTERRTQLDFAHQMKTLVDVHFPHADKIRLVVDNLNIHTPAAFYQAFEPTEARRLACRLEFHYTPKHGSWLNMVEAEIAVLSRQCLDRRIAQLPNLCDELTAWEQERNTKRATVRWQFKTVDARTKLKRLYPS